MLPHYPKTNIILKSYSSFINFNFLVKSKYLFLFDFLWLFTITIQTLLFNITLDRQIGLEALIQKQNICLIFK